MTTQLSSFGTGLNIVVIGASGGIGGAFVQQLCSDEHVGHIFAMSRSKTSFAHSKISTSHIDITDETSIAAAAQHAAQHGNIDIIIVATGILHNEHGLRPEKSLRDLNTEMLQQNYLINTIAPALIAKHFLPLLPRDRKSLFAALSARVSSISDNKLGGWYGYRASKSALNMMLKNAAIEIGRRYKDAIIIGLHPGTVDTKLSKPFQGHMQHDLFTPEISAKHLLAVINSKTPEDSGKLFAWDNQHIEF